MSEQPMNDATFSRLFIIMIIAMTVFTVVIIFLASFAASDVNKELDAQAELENSQAVADRIAPVGKFSATTVAAAPAVAAAPLTGIDAYTPCSSCHASGVLGAPIVGDAAAWAARLAKGTDALYASAIDGIGSMPAKGGLNLSDETVKAAVDYMLENSQ